MYSNITDSPSIAVRSMTKSSSLECPLSPSSFDETHAGRGLSLLELSDIQTMRHEMKVRHTIYFLIFNFNIFNLNIFNLTWLLQHNLSTYHGLIHSQPLVNQFILNNDP